MSEELKNNANNEMNDDELENVAGGIGGKRTLTPNVVFCPNCHCRQNLSESSPLPRLRPPFYSLSCYTISNAWVGNTRLMRFVSSFLNLPIKFRRNLPIR